MLNLTALFSMRPEPPKVGVGRVHRLDPKPIDDDKTCSVCGQDKPLDQFYFRKDRGRHMAECKACSNQRTDANAARRRLEKRIAELKAAA